MESVDVVIVGAGAVGLAVAQEIASSLMSVLVVERHDSFGRETSSRNSEVIHGGMYYPAKTLKARLCVEGRHLVYEECRKYSIPHKKIGKLIVAADESEMGDLEALLHLGRENGVEGFRLIDRHELTSMEPSVVGIAALYSPETGIVDSHRLMQHYYDKAKSGGAMIVFNADVSGIDRTQDGYQVIIDNNGTDERVHARMVINCAGLDSDMIAGFAGFDIGRLKYQLHYCKGQYFRVNVRKSRMISRLIYPVPKPKAGGLGIHATLDLAGAMRLGPDDEYLSERKQDYSSDPKRLAAFCSSAQKFMPFIERDDLSADTTGIRPKLQERGGAFRDFVIREESSNGFPGFINLIGIESPGLTASLAIAKMVSQLVRPSIG